MKSRILIAALLIATTAAGYAADKTRFWNLTSVTIDKLYLAPAGTTN